MQHNQTNNKQTIKNKTMKTKIEQLAEAFNLYTVENLPETHKVYYNQMLSNDSYKLKGDNLPDFFKEYNGCEIGTFYECREERDYSGKITYYIERGYVLYLAPDSDYLLMLMNYKGKYYFHPFYNYWHKYHGIGNTERNKVINSLKEPNKIGVFTDKKVKEWFNYCDDLMSAMENMYKSHNSKTNEIQSEVDGFCKRMREAGARITGENPYWIDTDLFSIRLTIHKDSNYLEKNINFRGNLNQVAKLTEITALTNLN